MKKLIEIIKELDLNRTDKHTAHSYIENFYQNLLEPYREKKLNILEIGIGSRGDCLKLWKNAFPNSKIYGIDKNQEYCLTAKKINIEKIINGNAYDKKNINSLPNFDIIIDDGPHTLESQIKCLELYFPKLNDKGMIIIEDIQKYEHIEILEKTYKKLGGFKIETYDLRKIKNRYDDIVIVFKNKFKIFQ